MNKEFTEKIPITVYGSDSKGEMFVEDTATALVARDWIMVPIRKRIPPGSEVIVFNKTNGNQAEFLVEEQDASGVYRARLKDQTVDIWEKDFGVAPDPVPDTRLRVHLLCKNCGTQESVQLEADEYASVAAGEVMWRHCAHCVEETDWQAASWLAEQRRLDDQRKEEQKKEAQRRAAAQAASAAAPAVLRPAEPAAPPPLPPPPPVEKAPEVIVELPPEPAPAAPAPPEAPINWAERRSSRRIQMKTRARVRRPDNRTEIVSPLNVSRGGIAFETAQQYGLDEMIQVALHYREGEQPLETLGSIVRVSPRGSTTEYGVKFG
jgi:hypothetical protein